MDSQKIVGILQPQISSSTQISHPSSKIDGVGLERWTEWKAPTFSMTAKPANVEDLQSIVKCATAHNIPFLATSSGHGYSHAYGKAKDVLEIDLTNFKDIHVDNDSSTVTIGGAVRHREVFEPLWAAKKQIPVGSCSSTSVVGVTLGGGLNWWQGVFGLLIDSLLSVKLVTASGELVTASKAENEELFWGIRGAGFNFGIVVSATYQTYDLINDGQTFVADLIFPYEKGLDIVKVLKEWEIDQDPLLAIAMGAMWSPDINGPCHLCSMLYLGPQKESMKYTRKLLDIGPVVQNLYMAPWNEVHYKFAMGVDAQLGIYGGPKNLYSGHVKHFDLNTFEWCFNALIKLWEEYPACRGTLLFVEDWPTKKMEELPDEETAFPHRDIMCNMIIMCITEDPNLGEMLHKWGADVRDRFQKTNGFGETKVYVSYGHGDEGQAAMYGERKLNRLRALKRRWDPQQMFSWNNAITL